MPDHRQQPEKSHVSPNKRLQEPPPFGMDEQPTAEERAQQRRKNKVVRTNPHHYEPTIIFEGRKSNLLME